MIRLIQAIKRMIFWAWTLKGNFDWDYGFAEEMFLIKLKRLQNHMNTDPFHMNLNDLYENLRTATDQFDKEWTISAIKAHRALNLTISLLERIQKSGFYDDLVGISLFYESYTHESRSNIEEMLDRDTSHKLKLSKEVYWAKLKPMLDRAAEIEKRDKKLAYNLIVEYSDGWWT